MTSCLFQETKNSNLLNDKNEYTTKFYVSSNPKQFISAAKLFYKVENAEEINL